MITKNKVRDYTGKNVGKGVYRELEEKVQELLVEAEERAAANGRSTILARDV